MSADQTISQIRTDLLAGITDQNRRHKRKRLVGAAPLVMLLATVFVVSSIGNEERAFAMSTADNGTIRVEVFPDFDQVEELEESLADVGLQSQVVHLRSHPSFDGRIEVTVHNNEGSNAFEFDDGEFVIETSAVEGPVEILIYAAAAEGEEYQFAPSIFSPGQLLAGLPCAFPNQPLTTLEIETRALDAGIASIDWHLFDELEAGAEARAETNERPDAFVVEAQLRNPDTLIVIATTSDPGPAAGTLMLGSPLDETVTCTPELAGQWN